MVLALRKYKSLVTGDLYNITSPLYEGVKGSCLSFNYKLNTVGNRLLIISVKNVEDMPVAKRAFNGTKSNEWFRGYLNIPDDTKFYIYVTTRIPEDWNTGDVAVDDIHIVKCPERK